MPTAHARRSSTGRELRASRQGQARILSDAFAAGLCGTRETRRCVTLEYAPCVVDELHRSKLRARWRWSTSGRSTASCRLRGGITSAAWHRTPYALPMPSVRTGTSKIRCTGYWTWLSAKTGAGHASTTPRKILRFSVVSPRICSNRTPAQQSAPKRALEILRERPRSRPTPGLTGNLAIDRFIQSPYFSENPRLILRQVLWIG